MGVEVLQMHWCDSASPLVVVSHFAPEPQLSPANVLCFSFGVHENGFVCHDAAAYMRVSDINREPLTTAILDELLAKFQRGATSLQQAAHDHDNYGETQRLLGKSQGLQLGRGYILDLRKQYGV